MWRKGWFIFDKKPKLLNKKEINIDDLTGLIDCEYDDCCVDDIAYSNINKCNEQFNKLRDDSDALFKAGWVDDQSIVVTGPIVLKKEN